MDQQPIILIMGAAGSGKGTQAKKIKEELGYTIVETGAILRELATKETDLAKEVKKIMNAGEHLSDDMVTSIMKDHLTSELKQASLLLDGYPRSIGQAEHLFDILKSIDKNPNNIVVIWIDVDRDIAEERLLSRLDGNIKRADDFPEGIKKRLDHFYHVILPVIEYYQDKAKVIRINGEGDINEIFSNIKQQLQQV